MESITEFIKGNGNEIQVGQYTIRELEDGSFWIEHESGEGAQVQKDTFEAEITDFYARIF